MKKKVTKGRVFATFHWWNCPISTITSQKLTLLGNEKLYSTNAMRWATTLNTLPT